MTGFKNRTATDEVIAQYSGYVQAIVSRIFGENMTKEDIEETVADVFVAYWHQREHIDSDRPLRPYLAGIARHLALNRLRRLYPTAALPEEIEDTLNLTRTVERGERQTILREALLTLSAADREIFERYYYYCQSVGTVAAQMDMSESNVKIRLHRGRQALKKILTERGICDEDLDL